MTEQEIDALVNTLTDSQRLDLEWLLSEMKRNPSLIELALQKVAESPERSAASQEGA